MLPVIDLEMADLPLSNENLLNHAGIDGFEKERAGIRVASEVWHSYTVSAGRK